MVSVFKPFSFTSTLSSTLAFTRFCTISALLTTMRIVFALLVLTACLATSSATLKILKAKFKPYKVVRYQQQPIVVSEPLPVTYARPVPTFSAHVSTYVSSPSIATYSVPLKTYAVPSVYESTYAAAPVAVYSRPLYDSYPITHLEPLGTHLVEGHYSHYDYKR